MLSFTAAAFHHCDSTRLPIRGMSVTLVRTEDVRRGLLQQQWESWAGLRAWSTSNSPQDQTRCSQ